MLLVCIFHSRCSLQSQSWFYNGPNQDSKNMADCPYQVTHRKLICEKNINLYNKRVIGIPTVNNCNWLLFNTVTNVNLLYFNLPLDWVLKIKTSTPTTGMHRDSRISIHQFIILLAKKWKLKMLLAWKKIKFDSKDNFGKWMQK